MWAEGVFLGKKGTSGEYIVGDASGIWTTRTLQRKPAGERWLVKSLEMVGGVPWRVNDEDAAVDGEKMDVGVKIMDESHKERLRAEVKFKESAPRRVDITKGDLEQHGYTQNCPGCMASLKGVRRQAHNEKCRARMEEALAGSEKLKNRNEKINEFLAKELEKANEDSKKVAIDSKNTDEERQGAKRRRKFAADKHCGIQDQSRDASMDAAQQAESSKRGREDVGDEDGGERSKRKVLEEDEQVKMDVQRVYGDIGDDDSDSADEHNFGMQ